jgi:hypothetical protein
VRVVVAVCGPLGELIDLGGEWGLRTPKDGFVGRARRSGIALFQGGFGMEMDGGGGFAPSGCGLRLARRLVCWGSWRAGDEMG